MATPSTSKPRLPPASQSIQRQPPVSQAQKAQAQVEAIREEAAAVAALAGPLSFDNEPEIENAEFEEDPGF